MLIYIKLNTLKNAGKEIEKERNWPQKFEVTCT